MNNHVIDVLPDGTAHGLGNPLHLPGKITSKRFSVIVPTRAYWRLAFIVLRYCFGDTGQVAAWTRGGPCHWTCVVLATGKTARCNDRQALVYWEHEEYFEGKCLDN